MYIMDSDKSVQAVTCVTPTSTSTGNEHDGSQTGSYYISRSVTDKCEIPKAISMLSGSTSSTDAVATSADIERHLTAEVIAGNLIHYSDIEPLTYRFIN